MSSRVWLAHGVHFNAEEIARLGKSEGRRLPLRGVEHGARVRNLPNLRARGCRFAAGVSASTARRFSSDSSNMMEAIRHALMIGRLRYGADKVTHRDALRWANCTARPAASGARTSAGSRKGMRPIVALFRLDEPRFSGAHDPLAALVLCGAHRADRVMIAGDWRVVDGRPVGLDLDRLVAEHRRAALDFA